LSFSLKLKTYFKKGRWCNIWRKEYDFRLR